MKTKILGLVALVGLLAGPIAAHAAATYTFTAEGVFSSDSTVTPGKIGDSYILTVVIDTLAVPVVDSGNTRAVFFGTPTLTVAGSPVASVATGTVSQFSSGFFQLDTKVGSNFFVGFYGSFDPAVVWPGGIGVLANPALLAAQGVVGSTGEFLNSNFSKVGDSARLVVPEPGTLVLLGLGLAGLGLSRRRKAN